ncbi:unnamed protein product [Rotaria sordida]|uniref:Apple domain-containing protein n=1 Tax=Rotaria sordida TaxID=392033 RepID=A0A819KTG8_9BILA|nr:unnamed protein product [Rotaria sordida]
MSKSYAVIVGDIGGTNARLQLLWYSRDPHVSIPSIVNVTRQTYRTNTFTGLSAILQRFLNDIQNEQHQEDVLNAIKNKKIRVVLAVCGPIWNNRRTNDTNNVRMEPDGSRWPLQHADTIENDLKLNRNSLVFLNDFEAIGYCLAAQVDSQANELCKFTEAYTLHQVSLENNSDTNTPIACLGAGTGLGACFLLPDGSGRYQVYPSEAGMTDTFSPRSEEEWLLVKYLRRNQSFIEIEQLVSGPAFVTMLQFYSEYLNQSFTSKLNHDLQQVSQDDAPVVISQHARDYNDSLCLRVVDTFLDIFGRVLGTAAQTFLPYRGLYITGGILPKLAWRWQNNFKNLLLKSYLDQGPKMSEIVARVPLFLINDDDLAIAITNTNGQHLIKFNEETLNKLRLTPSLLSTSVSYIDFEILNERQCAIECVKDQSICTGFSYDATNKMCSLFDDLTKIVDNDITTLRQELKPNVCDNVKCKPDAICISYNREGKQVPSCVCLNGQPTPDDCDKIEIGIWTDYNDWSGCSVTCGEGYQFRKRECLSSNDKTQKIPSDNCIGTNIEIQPCNVTTCPTYGPWTPWTPCSKFCGIGIKQRNRSCIPPGSNCGNYTHEQRACGVANCQRVAGIKETESDQYPLKGYLAIREGDILCVSQNNTEIAKYMADLVCKSIGLPRGAQYAILNPIRYNSTCYPGILCDGTEKDFYECKYDRTQTSNNASDLFAIIARCIVDGGFSPWSDWSPCSKTCDTGQTKRFRTCTDPSPSIPEPQTIIDNFPLAGMNCTGDYTQVKTCNEQSC